MIIAFMVLVLTMETCDGLRSIMPAALTYCRSSTPTASDSHRAAGATNAFFFFFVVDIVVVVVTLIATKMMQQK
jgi:hypothetical protein